MFFFWNVGFHVLSTYYFWRFRLWCLGYISQSIPGLICNCPYIASILSAGQKIKILFLSQLRQNLLTAIIIGLLRSIFRHNIAKKELIQYNNFSVTWHRNFAWSSVEFSGSNLYDRSCQIPLLIWSCHSGLLWLGMDSGIMLPSFLTQS